MYLSKNININSVEYNLKQVFKMFLSVLVNKYLNVFIFVITEFYVTKTFYY